MSKTVEGIIVVSLFFVATLMFIIMAISYRKKYGKIGGIWHPTVLALLSALVFALWGMVFTFEFFIA